MTDWSAVRRVRILTQSFPANAPRITNHQCRVALRRVESILRTQTGFDELLGLAEECATALGLSPFALISPENDHAIL